MRRKPALNKKRARTPNRIFKPVPVNDCELPEFDDDDEPEWGMEELLDCREALRPNNKIHCADQLRNLPDESTNVLTLTTAEISMELLRECLRVLKPRTGKMILDPVVILKSEQAKRK